jgi:hypothetical protein
MFILKLIVSASLMMSMTACAFYGPGYGPYYGHPHYYHYYRY